jgi:hypothetical protein
LQATGSSNPTSSNGKAKVTEDYRSHFTVTSKPMEKARSSESRHERIRSARPAAPTAQPQQE